MHYRTTLLSAAAVYLLALGGAEAGRKHCVAVQKDVKSAHGIPTLEERVDTLEFARERMMNVSSLPNVGAPDGLQETKRELRVARRELQRRYAALPADPTYKAASAMELFFCLLEAPLCALPLVAGVFVYSNRADPK